MPSDIPAQSARDVKERRRLRGKTSPAADLWQRFLSWVRREECRILWGWEMCTTLFLMTPFVSTVVTYHYNVITHAFRSPFVYDLPFYNQSVASPTILKVNGSSLFSERVWKFWKSVSTIQRFKIVNVQLYDSQESFNFSLNSFNFKYFPFITRWLLSDWPQHNSY